MKFVGTFFLYSKSNSNYLNLINPQRTHLFFQTSSTPGAGVCVTSGSFHSSPY